MQYQSSPHFRGSVKCDTDGSNSFLRNEYIRLFEHRPAHLVDYDAGVFDPTKNRSEGFSVST